MSVRKKRGATKNLIKYQCERKINPQMRLGKGYGGKRKTEECSIVHPNRKNIFKTEGVIRCTKLC